MCIHKNSNKVRQSNQRFVPFILKLLVNRVWVPSPRGQRKAANRIYFVQLLIVQHQTHLSSLFTLPSFPPFSSPATHQMEILFWWIFQNSLSHTPITGAPPGPGQKGCSPLKTITLSLSWNLQSCTHAFIGADWLILDEWGRLYFKIDFCGD